MKAKINENFAFAVVAMEIITILAWMIGVREGIWMVAILSFILSYPYKIEKDVYSLWGGFSREGSIYSFLAIWQEAEIHARSFFGLCLYQTGKVEAVQVCGFCAVQRSEGDCVQGIGVCLFQFAGGESFQVAGFLIIQFGRREVCQLIGVCCPN